MTYFLITRSTTPATTYNLYDYNADHVRVASFSSVDHTMIDGADNDGTDLGGTDYYHPTASTLDLNVATAATQGATEAALAYHFLKWPVGWTYGETVCPCGTIVGLTSK